MCPQPNGDHKYGSLLSVTGHPFFAHHAVCNQCRAASAGCVANRLWMASAQPDSAAPSTLPCGGAEPLATTPPPPAAVGPRRGGRETMNRGRGGSFPDRQAAGGVRTGPSAAAAAAPTAGYRDANGVALPPHGGSDSAGIGSVRARGGMLDGATSSHRRRNGRRPPAFSTTVLSNDRGAKVPTDDRGAKVPTVDAACGPDGAVEESSARDVAARRSLPPVATLSGPTLVPVVRCVVSCPAVDAASAATSVVCRSLYEILIAAHLKTTQVSSDDDDENSPSCVPPRGAANAPADDTPLLAGAESLGQTLHIAAPRVAAAVVPPRAAFTIEGISSPNSFLGLAVEAGRGAGPSGMGEPSLSDLVMPPPAMSEDPSRRRHADGHTLTSPTTRVPVTAVPVALTAVNKVAEFLDDYQPATSTFKWRSTSESVQNFATRVLQLCAAVEACLRHPTSTLFPVIGAPTYVLGDIHGSFDAVAFFLRSVLVLQDIDLTPCHILCLGDYVDRGPFPLECCVLLFELFLAGYDFADRQHHKVTLLRGNHEDAIVCGDMAIYGRQSFIAECTELFGSDVGLAVFDAVTDVFAHLPLAAEIQVFRQTVGDEVLSTATTERGAQSSPAPLPYMCRILCTHGGFPRFNRDPLEPNKLAALRDPSFPRFATLFPNNPLAARRSARVAQRRRSHLEGRAPTMGPLSFFAGDVPSAAEQEVDWSDLEVQQQWASVFDLMWSDPTVNDDDRVLDEGGFACNSRGGHVVSFSTRAVETFLAAHRYSMLFRAHQEKSHGLRLSKSSKVLTLFSSSNYMGHGNGAGCAIVTNTGKIQLVLRSSASP